MRVEFGGPQHAELRAATRSRTSSLAQLFVLNGPSGFQVPADPMPPLKPKHRMTIKVTQAVIRDEVSCIELLVGQVIDGGFDQAQEQLSELNAVANSLLNFGQDALPGLIASNDPVYRAYRTRLRHARTFLEPMV